jgi:hypothetical protein
MTMKTPEELAEEWAINWHKDCDYPNPILEIRQEATKHIFLAGYQAAAPQWISVKDRLPEIGDWVVVDSFDCCQRTMPPSNKFECIFVWKTTFNHYLKADAIKWWMPLPELPKPPEEEK